MPSQIEKHDDFLAMLDEYQLNQDKRVEGTIESIERNYTYLDVPGARTVVRVRSEELEGYKVGDTVEVMIVGLMETDDDQEYITASRRKIELEQNWSKIEDSFNNKTILDGVITKKVKGGYLVNALFYPGFLPNSLSEISNDEENVEGRRVKVIVKDIKADNKDKRSKKITYSVKDIRIIGQNEDFEKINIGDVVDCEVLEVLDFGLSVAIERLRGFIHISEISWKRLSQIGDMFKVGDKLKAKVISVDENKKNVKLSIKQLTEDPWTTAATEFKTGDDVEGTVTKVLNYGVFVEIADGIEGLVHISDFTWNKKKVNISDYAKEGETVRVKILDINPETKKLKLGFRQLVENPWENAEEKFAVGKELTGKIVELKDFGMFVEVVNGVDAFIHFSDYAWTKEEEIEYKKGDEVTFKVIEFNEKDRKIKGSIKAMTKSPWEKAMEELRVGLTVEKPIKNVMDFGVFVELAKGVDGFIPVQFLSKDFIKNVKEKFNVGDVVKAQIVEINKEAQKIKLSIKKIEIENEKREQAELIEKYSVSSED